MPVLPIAWQQIAADQHGVVGRRQLLSLGLTGSQARRHLANGQWLTVFPGVYLTHAGPVPGRSIAWAALIYAGQDAALSHGTALWLDGVLDTAPIGVHVTIPEQRRVAGQTLLRIHRSSALSVSVHPSRTPSRTRIEHSVLDHLRTADPNTVIDVMIRSTQRRLTTAARLRDALAARLRHPHRALITEVLAEVGEGVQSALERRYLRDVERAHGLPAGLRNRIEHIGTGNSYHDVRYQRWSTVVELDGRGAHPTDQAFRDLRRDNRLVAAGDAVLPYGWHDVVGQTCAVAVQVASVLQARGWPGAPRPCNGGCVLHEAA